MKVARNMTLSEPMTAVPQGRWRFDGTDKLVAASIAMAGILSSRGKSLRVTVGANSIVIGNGTSAGEPVEFRLSSEKIFSHLFRRMRLIDFVTAYFDGHLQVIGPISEAVDVLYEMNLSTDRPETPLEFYKDLVARSLKVLHPIFTKRFESLEHYSQSASAYELFLDNYMQYTCGHFPKGDETLDEAQLAKFNLIEGLANKYMGPLIGKAHLDIGSGWGGMGAYFRNELGMRSIGNTNCVRQMEYAQQRYGSEILYGDFLELKKHKQGFDLVTIVGMIEHLTPYRRSQLLEVVRDLLTPNGIVYLQCITKPPVWWGGDTYRVAKREIFPGHFLETRSQTGARLEASGFSILEQHEHHSDYALTTSHWVASIQRNEDALVRILGARGYRMYLGYLAFASKLFSIEGRGSLMRYVFKKAPA